MPTGREFQIHGAQKRKARDPNDRLYRGIIPDEKRMSVKTYWADDVRGQLDVVDATSMQCLES